MKPKKKTNKKKEQDLINNWFKEFKVSSQYIHPDVKKLIEFDDVIHYARNLNSIGFNGKKYS